MKKYFLIILAALMIAIFTACGDVSFEKKGETTQGTPIIDAEQDEFDINDVQMQSTPNSTCFSQIGYDSTYDILFVTFRESGSTYIYTYFSDSDWNSFTSAESLGKYYNEYIKGFYDCNKVE